MAGDDGDLDSFLDGLAKDLFDHKIKDGEISAELYDRTTNKLFDALNEGLGGSSFSFSDERNTLKAFFQDNLAQFSAAKSLTELKYFNSLLIKENGEVRTFTEFRNKLIEAGVIFNKNHLLAEYNTAVAAAQNARQYFVLKANGVEYLTFTTMGDDRVRPAHRILEGFTTNIDDPIWAKMMPPLAFNCRCFVIPGVAEDVGKIEAKNNMTLSQLFKAAEIPKQFQNNPALSKVIFTQSHPYFELATVNGKPLQAEANYGLRPVGKTKGIYDVYKFEAPKTLSGKAAVNEWWTEKAGKLRASWEVTDQSGVTVQINNEFRNHVMEQNADGRESIIANVEAILKAPDEIWSIVKKSKLQRTYIKYYKDFPIVVQVNEKAEAYTMFELSKSAKDGKVLNESNAHRLRQGNLIYNKTR